MRQFDLELAFAGAGVNGENVENELRAVDHATADAFFHVAKLNRGEVVVDNDERNFAGVRLRANFFEFAFADERCGINGVANLQHRPGNIGAGADGELLELAQGIAAGGERIASAGAGRLLEAHTDKQDAFPVIQRMRSLHSDVAWQKSRELRKRKLI